MEKQIITKEKAIQDLKEIFNIPEEQTNKTWKDAYETSGGFGVNKQFMGRFDVIAKLQEYFKDKMFVVGLCLEVGAITLIYTTFRIKEL